MIYWRDWNRKAHHQLEMVTDEFRQIPFRATCDNLNGPQRQALKELEQLKDVLIKPAEKGGNIILWPKEGTKHHCGHGISEWGDIEGDA